MEKLNEDILSKILSDVPIEFVSRCKLVCRSWERLLSRKNGGLLFSVASRGQRNAELYYADYYDLMSIDNPHRDEPNYSFKTCATEIDHPPINKINERGNRMCVAIGSHNENPENRFKLTALSRYLENPSMAMLNSSADIGSPCLTPRELLYPVYVCNPVSREYINLPRFNRRKGGYIVSGFGYLSSTDEYKVVRICYPDEKLIFPRGSAAGWVQVYTLGNSGWRDVGEITNTLWLPGVQANGALHFMDDVAWKIMAFDLEAEEFGVLPQPPPCFGNFINSSYQVQVLGGDLYVVHQQNGKQVDIWSFKHNGNKNQYGPRGNDYESWSWSKKFCIKWPSMGTSDYYEPFAITERSEVLFWMNDWNLCCYDHETGVFKKIVDMNDDNRLSICQGIPYKRSLVSLKDLGVPSKIRRRKTCQEDNGMGISHTRICN